MSSETSFIVMVIMRVYGLHVESDDTFELVSSRKKRPLGLQYSSYFIN